MTELNKKAVYVFFVILSAAKNLIMQIKNPNSQSQTTIHESTPSHKQQFTSHHPIISLCS